MAQGGLGQLLGNLWSLPRQLCRTLAGRADEFPEKARPSSLAGSFFLHFHTPRVHPRTLRPSATWGLGVALVSLFLILTFTGLLLMVYYKPSAARAYESMLDLRYAVPGGRIVRNLHRWAAHLMVVCVVLHAARVFYTGAYKSARALNWLVGLTLLVLTLALSFTGYLLPWDQLAYWAATIGANIAASPDELAQALGLPTACHVGEPMRRVLLGGSAVGEEALIRFYALHVLALPLLAAVGIGLHVWRIRKDGGLARSADAEPVALLPSWPLLPRAEVFVFMSVCLVCLALAFWIDAPLREPANPQVPENPAKAPWYFLGVQELVSYSAFAGGVLIPLCVLLGLAAAPCLDRGASEPGAWFDGRRGRRIAAASLLLAAAAATCAVTVPVRFGWLREWCPDAPQLAVLAVNPGTLLAAAYGVWALSITHRTGSTRLGAIAAFTCLLAGFAVVTCVGIRFRGPDWEFFWSKAHWPPH